MKIQYCSDLHLEFYDNYNYIKSLPLKAVGDILVVAGDCFYLKNKVMPRNKLWKWASDNFEQVLLVPGNHEFYGNSDITSHGNSWEWKFRKNVGYYYNKVVTIGDTNFILSTLWSKIDPKQKEFVWYYINDFRQIMYNGHRLKPEEYDEEHTKCLNFIKKAVSESKAKHKVVVTHHAPSRFCVDPDYKDSNLESAFTVDLTDFIIDSDVDVWIYGHSHTNINARIGNTRVVCNQLGYVTKGEHLGNGFDFESIIEV